MGSPASPAITSRGILAGLVEAVWPALLSAGWWSAMSAKSQAGDEQVASSRIGPINV